MKKVFLFILTFIVLIVSVSAGQKYILTRGDDPLFVEPLELMPPLLEDYLRREEIRLEEKKIEARPIDQRGYLHAGEKYEYLRHFFQDLEKLEKGKRDRVRITHYGDSLIWGERFASVLREKFQERYGDGGRGVVPVVEIPPTALEAHVNRTTDRLFDHYVLKHKFNRKGVIRLEPGEDARPGFTGESARPLSSLARARFIRPEGHPPHTRARVFLHSSRDRHAVSYLKCGNSEYEQSVISRKEGAVARYTLEPCRDMELWFKAEGPVYIDGVSLEREKGIIYDSIVRMGIHMSWLDTAVHPERVYSALKELEPSLIIFQFGVNEAATLKAIDSFTEETYRRQLRSWLGRVKKLLPETDILLIGPFERMEKRGGRLVPFQETMDVRRIQMEEANNLGCAFFDTYSYLGGAGHMRDLVSRGWAVDDYTHLTTEGGNEIGTSVHDSLMARFDIIQGREADRKKLEAMKLEIRAPSAGAIQFNSRAYAWFLIAVLLVTLLLYRFPRLKIVFLIGASWYFYSTWKIWPVGLLIFSTLLDYTMGRAIFRSRQRGGRGTFFLVLSLLGNLGVLGTFKYFDFFSNLAATLATSAGFSMQPLLLNTLLPVGISFYTFQSLSYTIDVWRGEMKPERNIFRFALFVSFFPQLVAGPIVRAKNFIPALNNRNRHFRVVSRDVYIALFLIGGGLLKKMGADWLAANIIDRVYQSPDMFSSVETLTAVLAYGLQIYGDFSGYTDIALGSARLLGFNLTENFNRPYQSRSVSEFWRRWHISLGTWFRDYLYISLGGNRKRVYFNLFITMFLCGLWHGAAINFVLWGLYHGAFLMIERATGIARNRPGGVAGILRQAVTFVVVIFGWIIFRSSSWETFTGILSSLAAGTAGMANITPLLVSVIGLAYLWHFTPVSWREWLKARWTAAPALLQGGIAAGLLLFLYRIQVSDVKPFIYFQF